MQKEVKMIIVQKITIPKKHVICRPEEKAEKPVMVITTGIGVSIHAPARGWGTIKITDECKDAGLPEPEFKEEFGGFAVYFYKDIYADNILRKLGLNNRQLEAVKYIKERGDINL